MTQEQRIKELAQSVGFTACGITSAEPFEEFQAAIKKRMERFPEAAHLYAPLAKRMFDPRSSTPWANSIVVCIMRYGKYRLPEGIAGHIGRCYLPYPCWQDSEVMKAGLAEMGLRVASANAGALIPVRWAAARAGVARFGRNNCAYSKHGSWMDVRAWFVDAKLEPDKPSFDSPCPEGCNACIKACPTGAIVEPFAMRWDRCITNLTRHSPEPVPSELWERMGVWIYGCDRCQEVCPLNKGAWEPLEEAPAVEQLAPLITPAALASMDMETYKNIIQPRFNSMPVSALGRWHRNATRALRNQRSD